jgi:hypothetical protein
MRRRWPLDGPHGPIMIAMDAPLPFHAASTQQQTIHAMFAAAQAQEERQALEFIQWHAKQRERLIREFRAAHAR